MTISDIITFDLLSRYDGKIKNWIKALKASTTQDGLMSKEDKATLDGLVSTGGQANVIEDVTVNGQTSTITNKVAAITIPEASTSASGVMSSGDKTKLNNIAANAEVNQNAFSNVKVGSTTIQADSKTDTLELVAGGNVTLTPDASGDKVTIAAQDTTYDNATTSAAGLMSSDDKTKLNNVAAGAQVNVIESIEYDGAAVSISGKKATITPNKDLSNYNNATTKFQSESQVDTKIANALTSAVIYNGSVAKYSDLPSTGVQNGWLYNVTESDMNYVWNSTSNAWDPQSPTVTIAAATTAQIDSLFT